jgi:hypothetical protein
MVQIHDDGDRLTDAELIIDLQTFPDDRSRDHPEPAR